MGSVAKIVWLVVPKGQLFAVRGKLELDYGFS